MEQKKVRELKIGELFTRKPIEFPKESQVYIRGEYCRSDKRYSCTHWADISWSSGFKGDTVVYTGFTF